MSFFEEVQKSWEKGIKGTKEVPLETGIQAVLKTAQKVFNQNIPDKQIEQPNIEEKE